MSWFIHKQKKSTHTYRYSTVHAKLYQCTSVCKSPDPLCSFFLYSNLFFFPVNSKSKLFKNLAFIKTTIFTPLPFSFSLSSSPPSLFSLAKLFVWLSVLLETQSNCVIICYRNGFLRDGCWVAWHVSWGETDVFLFFWMFLLYLLSGPWVMALWG